MTFRWNHNTSTNIDCWIYQWSNNKLMKQILSILQVKQYLPYLILKDSIYILYFKRFEWSKTETVTRKQKYGFICKIRRSAGIPVNKTWDISTIFSNSYYEAYERLLHKCMTDHWKFNLLPYSRMLLSSFWQLFNEAKWTGRLCILQFIVLLFSHDCRVPHQRCKHVL